MIPDRDLVTFLDELVAERKIDIPPSEVRTGRTYSGRLGKDRSTAISSLGTKSVKHPPMIHLYAQIWNTYQKPGMIEDLTWRVGYSQGNSSSAKHALMNFLHEKGPEVAVKELILSSRAVTAEIGTDLIFKVRDGEDKTDASRRLLWKFGFRVLECPAQFVPVEVRQTGTRGAEDGARKEA
jgi:hypothetical protein